MKAFHFSSFRFRSGAFSSNPSLRGRRCSGFTLIELLTVLCIMVVMASLSGPLLRTLQSAGETGKAFSDMSGLLEFARAHAMAQNTYVRLAFGEKTDGGKPMTIVVAFFSTDGTGSGNTANPVYWLPLKKPLILDNFQVRDALSSGGPDTQVPSESDIEPFQYKAAGAGLVSFSSFVQFDATGVAAVLEGEPARFIEIGLDRPAPLAGKNPIVLRVSGINGAVTALRKEDGI